MTRTVSSNTCTSFDYIQNSSNAASKKIEDKGKRRDCQEGVLEFKGINDGDIEIKTKLKKTLKYPINLFYHPATPIKNQNS